MSKSKTLKTSAVHSTARDASGVLLVDVDDVSVSYGEQVALHHVSLCIHAGEFIGIIGPNGAGKTTLLRVLLGLQDITSGSLHATQDYTVGYVPQRSIHHAEHIPFSVEEVVRMGGASAREAHTALESVMLADVSARRFDTLSGGQQQRVLIAKALARDPAIIILDEPMTGIDERAQVEFAAIVDALHQRGITVVMVSHDVDAVLSQVSRVVCINGVVLYDGPPEHFEADTYLPQMYAARHKMLHHKHEDGHA